MGFLVAHCTHIDDVGNLLAPETGTGSGSFRVIWGAREDRMGGDEWDARITAHGGSNPTSYSFLESVGNGPGHYEMIGTVNIQDEGSLSIRVRGRFGNIWGGWSPAAGLFCLEGSNDDS